ncbi:MAG TPA: sensor histidine kinase [Bacteroidia bacterium]|nr:sensor histidine kinase [Bacteroidia bacterium]
MSNALQQIFSRVHKLTGVKRRGEESLESSILRGLEILEEKREAKIAGSAAGLDRIQEILGVIMSLANLDYNHKAPVSDALDEIDALAGGINMLGEELKSSTVSLHEKETLLKEIHHRVKNNLQVISSLLNLQADRIEDPLAREKFLVCRERIRTMSMVHEKLYESGNLSSIDFPEYIESLARTLNNSYNTDKTLVKLHTDVGNLDPEDRRFKIETAIPCGLILNELLSNAYKYAFPEQRKGNVRVLFDVDRGAKAGHYRIRVEDDGVGLPEKFLPEKAETLGMQLVWILAEQLEGKLDVESGKKGTAITLTFNGNA